jgi:hypothetical protein
MTALARLLLAAGLTAACIGCVSARRFDAGLDYVRDLVRRMDCQDGAPARVLIDAHCPQGICGVTCAPERWRE